MKMTVWLDVGDHEVELDVTASVQREEGGALGYKVTSVEGDAAQPGVYAALNDPKEMSRVREEINCAFYERYQAEAHAEEADDAYWARYEFYGL